MNYLEEKAMKWYFNLKIGTKLLSGFILVALITGVVGYIGYSGMKQVKAAQDDVATVRLSSVSALWEINEAQSSVRVAERTLSKKGLTMTERDTAYKEIEDAMKRAEEGWAIYEALPQTTKEKEEWDKFVPLWETWEKDVADFVSACREADKITDTASTEYLTKFNHLTELTMGKTRYHIMRQMLRSER